MTFLQNLLCDNLDFYAHYGIMYDERVFCCLLVVPGHLYVTGPNRVGQTFVRHFITEWRRAPFDFFGGEIRSPAENVE